MAEILTESFCERCGTRYTFQSAAPKVGRLAKMKVLSRGLKNYVLSDETSLDEALADARSVDDRETSVEQLDAFHKTFNFCMSCRQYTCANCWNDREGRCLSCAPSLSVGLLPSGMPALDPVSGIAGLAGNGHGTGNGLGDLSAAGASAWPQTDLGIAPDEGAPFVGSAAVEEKPLSRLEALFGREAAAKIEAGTPGARSTEWRESDGVPEMIGLEGAPAPTREPEPVIAAAEDAAEADEAETAEEPLAESVLTLVPDETGFEDAILAAEEAAEPVAAEAVAEADEEPAAATAATAEAGEPEEEVAAAAAFAPEPIASHPVDPETDELAAAAAAQTHGLLDKFRAKPAAMAGPQPILPMPAAPRLSVPIVPAAPIPSIITPAQLPYAAVGPQPEPAMPQPFGVIGRPPSSAPAPQPYGAPVAMPYAAQAPQPYDAPVQPYPAPTTPYPTPAPAMYPPFRTEYTAPTPPHDAPPPPAPQFVAPQPQYAPPPAAPSWRMVAPESPFLAPAPGNGHIGHVAPAAGAGEPEWPTTPSWPAPLARGAEAVWAESTRDLLSRPEAGVSACFNCGLPLSATARFCRRCGTSQVAS